VGKYNNNEVELSLFYNLHTASIYNIYVTIANSIICRCFKDIYWREVLAGATLLYHHMSHIGSIIIMIICHMF